MRRSGHIRKRGNVWYLIVEQPRKASARQQKWIPLAKNKLEAQAKADDILAKMAKGVTPRSSNIRLAAYLGDWLPTIEVKPRTLVRYGQCCRHISEKLGDKRLKDLTIHDITSYYAEARNTGRMDGKGGLSARSVTHIHTVLKLALDDAVREGLVAHNISTLARVPKGKKNRQPPATLDRSQIQALLKGIQESAGFKDLYAPIQFALGSGARRGEILGLKWEDLDLEAGYVAVQRQLIAVGGELKLDSTKTHRSRRRIALPQETVKVLKTHKSAQKLQAWHGISNEQDLVFCLPDGRPRHPDTFSHQFSKLVKSLDIPYITLHGLRHTHATQLLRMGENPKVVSERLGHSTVTLTLDTYSHVMPGLQEAAAAKMDKVLA